MKSLLIAVFLPLFVLSASASEPQFRIKGHVADSLGTAVGYATVASYRDTTLLNAVAADAEGRFETSVAEKGRYTLKVSAVGFATAEQPVEVKADPTDAGTVTLRPGLDIADVVVEVRKPLIVADAEKMTYSVEDDPQASTSTLDEIIRKIPQLSLDADGNVLLNGQSNYKILLNGHPAISLSRNFKDIIKSMPASQIKKIEVITNPSIKYDAEGAGGIINIITEKKNSFDGYNGSVRAGVGFVGMESYNGSANISVQTGKFAVGASAYYGLYKTRNQDDNLSTFSQENIAAEQDKFLESRSSNNYRSQNYGFSLDLSYQPDTLNLITLSGSLWTGRHKNTTIGSLETFDANHNPGYGYDQWMNSLFKYTGGTVALNYEHTFNRAEHTLTFSDEISIDPDDYTVENWQNWRPPYEDRTLQTGNWEPTRSIENTVQVDYCNPITEHHRIEAGVKHIFRSNIREDIYTNTGNDGILTERFADMDYRQHILGLYASYAITYEKWSARLGGRFEHTWNDAKGFDKTDYVFSNRMGNVVPYASLTYMPKQGHNLSFTYTQRLSRPGIYQLSSVVDDTDPLFVSYGNPDLKSAVFNSLSLQYNYFSTKWSASVGLSHFLSNNYMTNYSFVDSKGITYTTYGNGVKARSYGLSGSVSYRPSQKFSLSLSYNGGYGKYDYDEQGIHTDQFSCGESLNMDVALWKGARLILGQSYYLGGAGLGYVPKTGWLNYYAGLKQKFFKERLELSLVGSNFFEQYRESRSLIETPTYVQHALSRYLSRSINFSISFRFGRQDVGVKSTSRSISNDDQSSGSSKGGGGK